MKKVLITGGNRGIGKAIAENMLSSGYYVVITSREYVKGLNAVEELKTKTGNNYISCVEADLSSIKGCNDLLRCVKSRHPDISILINNAGVWMTEKILNDDGLEMSFMVNYLAPYILCQGLKENLMRNAPSRIVNMSAGLYKIGKLDIIDSPIGNDFNPIKTYATSKLAGVMFAIDFSEQIEGTGVTINSIHPGIVNTNLGNSRRFFSKVVKMIKQLWKSVNYGAEAPVWLATNPDLASTNGLFFNEKKPVPYAKKVFDRAERIGLRRFTERILEKDLMEIKK